MTGITVSVPPTQPTGNPSPTLQFSWDIQSKTEMAAWLQSSADRLIVRARAHPDRSERDRLLRMAAAAIETAGWYQNDGAR
jgi:hypothetical protein